MSAEVENDNVTVTSKSLKSSKSSKSGKETTSLSINLEELPEGLAQVVSLLHTGQVFESPIDIHLPNTTPIDLPPLEWIRFDLPPKKIKFNNTGHTVILSGKWQDERPYLSGGPFLGNFVFSQLHFHWGINNMEGSEHTISGCTHPLEMHVVYFNSKYLTQEDALKQKDGICVTVFMFQLQDVQNPSIQLLVQSMPDIREAGSSVRLKSYKLTEFMTPFAEDYFLYIGTVNTRAYNHYIMWLMSREPIGVSIEQMEEFRSLFDIHNEPMERTFRYTVPTYGRPVFHVNPSKSLHSTLLAMKTNQDLVPTYRQQQTTKYPRSSKEYVGTTIYRGEIIVNPFVNVYFGQKEKQASKERANKSIINLDPRIIERIRELIYHR